MESVLTDSKTGNGLLFGDVVAKVIHSEPLFDGLGPAGSATLTPMKVPNLIFPVDAEREGLEARHLARLRNRGTLVRVRRSAYVDAQEWEALDARSRYGLKVEAYQRTARALPVYTHATAALLWGLWLRRVPIRLHVLTGQRSGGMNKGDIVRHREPSEFGTVRCGDLVVADKLATVMSLITSLGFQEAVAVCDSALARQRSTGNRNIFTPPLETPAVLRPSWNPGAPQGPPLEKAQIYEAIARLPSAAGRKRATAVVDFSSGLSGSIGESLSRVRMDQLGFEAPILQKSFVLRNGSNAYVDFWFKESGVVGEFDGREKYLRADWSKGRSLQERILAEKDREDQIRGQGVGFVRWTWGEMENLQRFESLLSQAGVARTGTDARGRRKGVHSPHESP